MLGTVIICLALGLSGCDTTTQSASGADARLQGTWQGSLPLSMNGGGNSTLTKISFTDGNAVLTIVSDFGTRTMNATYQTSSGSLVLRLQFGQGFDRQGFNGSMLPNGTRPPFNGSWPVNGTGPGNGTRPDGNGSQPPGSQQQETMTFTYRVDDGNQFLYLDNAAFSKVS